MKKLIITLGFALFAFNIFAQLQPIILSGVKIDSFQINDGVWITEISEDGALSDSSIHAIPTEAAVKRYVDSLSASATDLATRASVDSLADTTAQHNLRINQLISDIVANSVSIDSLADTTALHNLRLLVLEAAKHSHSNKTILDNTTVAFTDAINTAVTSATNDIASLQDSIDAHTDSLQILDGRLSDLETGGLGLLIQPIHFIKSGAIAAADTIGLKITISDTDDPLIGMNLVKASAGWINSYGSATATVIIQRSRDYGDTWVNMTSTGATFAGQNKTDDETTATINPSYDDIALGDMIRAIVTLSAGTAPGGLDCTIICQTP